MKRYKDILIAIIVSFSVMVIAYAFTTSMKKNLVSQNSASLETDYSIAQTWDLPNILDEVSGIAWIQPNLLACVQDEKGIIFVYDLEKKSVVKEISFANAGDYEGIAVNGSNAYVMRSDGLLYEILNYNNASKTVNTYETGFSATNNMETLEWDSTNKILITSPKDKDSNSDTYKGVYYFSLEDKGLVQDPLFKIDMNLKEFDSFKEKKAYKTFSPSDIAIHPITKEIYVLEGKKPKLLVYHTDGILKNVHMLDTSSFAQPEGITFSPDGDLYISNETKGGSNANIHLIELK